MAAPVRYLSGRQQQQKIGIEGSTQNEKVLEVVGRAGIGTTAFEPGVGLEVRGDQIVTGILTVGSVEVSTTSTFTGNIDANGNLDVDGHTELDDVNVSGASTFTGAADFNGNLDVDGHTELDDVNVSGASTFTGAADFNGNLDVDGHTELDDVNIAGVLTATTINATTFVGNGDFVDIDVDGQTELDNLNVSGVSTFVGVATFSTNDVYVAQRLFVGGVEVGGTTNTFAGINTFTDTTDNTLGNSNTGAVQLDGGLGVDKNVTIGAGLSVAGNAGIGSLNVAGVSTFVGLLTVTSGDVYIAQRLFVGGLEVEGTGSENTFTGINTFTNQADNVLGDTNTGSLQGNGGLGIDKNASFGSTVFVQNAIGINSTAPIGQFDVNGHTELDDVNVSGAITATTFTGNLAGTATIAEYTSEWNITSNGSSDYRFTGPGFDGTENDPTIYLTRGEEYKFTNNMGAHPFQIRTAINGSAYNDGITNNGVSNGTLTWDVQMDAPNVLYYQCTAHAGMVGKIYIGNSGSSIDIDGHTETDTLNVSGLSTFTGAADFNGNVDIDGHTELDSVNVSGASTFGGNIDLNAALDVSGNITGSGDLTLTDTDAGSSAGPELKLYRNSGTPADADYLGQIKFAGESDTGVERNYAKITGKILDASNTNEDGILEFAHIKAGSQTITGRFRSDSLQLLNSTNFSVDGTSTFTGNVDANGGLDVSGSALTAANGLVANSAQISDLTSGRVVLAGTSGELEDNSKLTFNGTTLTVAGDASFNGNVTIGGTLTSEDKTNVDSIGLVTARSGVRISAGGLVVTSGVSTFTDNIIGNLTGTATTATNLAGGDTGDIPYQSANGTTTFVDATGVGQGLVLMWGGSNPIWSPVSGASGNFGGITLLEEGSTVGTAGSVVGLNFVGNNVTATAPSGIANGVVTLSDTPTFDSLKVTGISTIPNVSGVTTFSDIVNVGTGITFYASSGIISATQFYGSGENLTDLINQRIEGIRILDEGVQVGSGTTFTNLNFVGNGVVATGIGTTGIITITDTTFEADAQENLYAGTSAGAASDADTCFNIGIGYSAGSSLNAGDSNVFLGRAAGKSVTNGSYNTFFGWYAGAAGNGTQNVLIGTGAGKCAVLSSNNIYLGTCAGKCASGSGANNTFLGIEAGCSNQGCNNNFFGKFAGKCNTTGCDNIALGCYSGCALTEGDENIFIGKGAGQCVTTGCCNIFLGVNAASTAPAKTGNNNIMLGANTGQCLQAGSNNSFLGAGAGQYIRGSYNIGIGDCAGRGSQASSDGGCNVSIGKLAGGELRSGADNVLLGRCAGYGNYNGNDRVAIGCGSGYTTTNGDYTVFIGKGAGCHSRGYYNIAIGCGALIGNSSSSDGACNIAIGLLSGRCVQTGNHNIFLGTCAGTGTSSGCYNIFFGKFTAAQATITGGCNVALGMCAGYKISSGTDNVFLGKDAGYNSADGGKNIFIGVHAGCTNTSGDSNIAIGCGVQLPSATGDNQMAIGSGTNRWLTGDSSYNVTVSTASTFSNDGLNVTGVVTATSFEGDGSALTGIAADKIFEGNTEVETVDTGSNGHIKFTTEGSERARIDASGRMGIGVTNPVAKLEVNVGSAVTAFDIQGSAGQLFSVTNNLTSGSIFSVNDVSGIPSIDVDADGTIQLAPFSTTEFVGVGTTNPTTKLHVIGEVTATDFNSTSDARLKTNVQVIDDPLAKVLQINGVSFNWVENNKPSMGVIADNIEEVLPELVSDTDPKTVNYNGLIGLLIEVVKDQQTQINSLNERLSQLE
jgi:cytoskeletal protein CcmA (bactofilin family)